MTLEHTDRYFGMKGRNVELDQLVIVRFYLEIAKEGNSLTSINSL